MEWKILEYDKAVDVELLTQAIINAGFIPEPDPGYNFGGCVCHLTIPKLLVYVYPDITPAEEADIDAIVAAQATL